MTDHPTSTESGNTLSPLTDTLLADANGWRLVESGWNADRAVAVGSNFLVGNGYLGYRGTSPEERAGGYVALVVTDTYDCADGKWRELTTAPNPLFSTVSVDSIPLTIASAETVATTFDLASGEYRCRRTHRVGDTAVVVDVERFADQRDLHALAQRITVTVDRDATVELTAGIDTMPWSLNGVHLPTIDCHSSDGALIASGTTVESGIDLVVGVATSVGGPDPTSTKAPGDQPPHEGDDLYVTHRTWNLSAGSSVSVDSQAAVASSNDDSEPAALVEQSVRAASADGFLSRRHRLRERWAEIWSTMDVAIEGPVIDQAALRFSLYHNRICTPVHTERLPIGARGLSCQAYQGAAFWDQEVYNLPAFLFTDPDVARSLLVYRHLTLDGARRKAARLGYDGAYYAWISGTTGDELCPDVFFHDVLTGRPIRNHFNVWQMHVAPDVVTTVERYVEVTGDVDFLVDHGAEIAFEVARFLRSFVRFDEYHGVYHNIRLLGPDEWHENVDDNAFTNHQTHRALAFAIRTHELMAESHPDELAALTVRLGLDVAEVDGWRCVHDRLLLPEPDATTMLIEQFDGFFDLEDVTPAEVRQRLIDPTEYWGWPNGVAVATQVSKQADVAMLLWLHADRFDDATVRANYEYYEPRCSHNSSLSHAAYGMLSARLGDAATALEHFRATATVDLLNTNHAVVAGTFIGGIHTAACAGTYQLAVNGIGGLDVADGVVTLSPALPDEWTSLTYTVRLRGQQLTSTLRRDEVTWTADSANTDAVAVKMGRSDAPPTLVEPDATVIIPVP